MLAQTTSLILETFSVSREAAEVEARGMLDFLAAKGGAVTDWEVIHRYVVRHLGQRLPWRSEARRLEAQETHLDTVAAYNRYIDGKN
jgi:hypothetical protein